MLVKRGVIPETVWQSAVRFRQPQANPRFGNTSGRKLYLGRDASNYIDQLKGYERQQVSKTIMNLSGVPSPPGSIASRSRPAFFKAVKIRVGASEFVVKYWVTSAAVVVSEIVPTIAHQGKNIQMFNDVEFGGQLSGVDGAKLSREQKKLYNILRRNGKARGVYGPTRDVKGTNITIQKYTSDSSKNPYTVRVTDAEIREITAALSDLAYQGGENGRIIWSKVTDQTQKTLIVLNDMGNAWATPDGISFDLSGSLKFTDYNTGTIFKPTVTASTARILAHEGAHYWLRKSESGAVDFADKAMRGINGTKRGSYSNQ
jgi:hypothetical protein